MSVHDSFTNFDQSIVNLIFCRLQSKQSKLNLPP